MINANVSYQVIQNKEVFLSDHFHENILENDHVVFLSLS